MTVVDDDEDLWSDAHDTMEDEHSVGHPAGIEGMNLNGLGNQDSDDLALKITTDGDQDPSLESSRETSLSTNGVPASDTASVHSLPVVHVSHPQSPLPSRPSTARTLHSPTSAHRAPPSSLRGPLSPSENSLTPQDRRNRHRSALETRSPSRLSGFFTNLIHRRDPVTSPIPRSQVHEERPSSPVIMSSNDHSRASSPALRPVTPPPPLPAPTLQDLGLCLSVLTLDLSPSHFTTPPWSGAFLGPHYLLLCHAQGLDVLPLVSPPAMQPYALVRRVSFKSVVIMEQRGVLVAIAGRRDGVRVYALEEVKKAVEWRIEVEVRRERERARREAAKKAPSSSLDSGTEPDSVEKKPLSLSSPPSTAVGKARLLTRRASTSAHSSISPITPTPKIPRTPTLRTPRTAPPLPLPPQEPLGRPPPYSSRSPLESQDLENDSPPVSFIQSQSRRSSVSNVLAAVPTIYRHAESDIHKGRDQDSKADWIEARDSSDDEAINIVAAASSGSQALDERTSTRLPAAPSPISPMPPVTAQLSRTQPSLSRRNRPANLDLTLSLPNTPISPPEPSPTPTLLTLRQALSQSPGSPPHPHSPDVDLEEDDDDGRGITLAQALMESRLPDLPPVGSRRPQQAILITSSHVNGNEDIPSSPRTSETHSIQRHGTVADRPERRRRRWSVLDGVFSGPMATQSMSTSHTPTSSTSLITPVSSASPGMRRSNRPSRPPSVQSQQPAGATAPVRSASASHTSSFAMAEVPPVPDVILPAAVTTPSRSRFIPRIISNAFNGRRSDDHSQAIISKTGENDTKAGSLTSQYAPPPKLEYVKLPGTKGSILIKAVETAKKSFLAILCGENGEKVELFAGTYRTALGLSRTFILPDSPRSLELQLQGDDLVEVFLVFSQNVFGLEPATVRVREVRIGRAERRAARRRAREIRTGEPSNDTDTLLPGDEDMRMNVSIGVAVAPTSTTATGDGDRTPPLLPGIPDDGNQIGEQSNTALAHAEELASLATAQMGPYTTFQQLPFAPKFPLAAIADDYIIPPTYPDFLQYRSEHEPEINGSHTSNMNLAHVQFSPPGLPIPGPSAPSKWFYRDPKDVIHGPWKASLMQAWYKDGLLPPDLPVRREEENDYVLLKDLRLQCVDPTHPFRSPPTPLNPDPWTILQDTTKPLLKPISLLSQPKHFGPPALFFSSRGGHSTAIVDARGRSVLKGRFLWSGHDDEESKSSWTAGRMGDVKRLEAFDVKDRAVLVAMRQGGLEAMDLGDALLRPADESRTVLPQFSPPPSNINRRGPFVWRIGTPVSATSSSILPPKSRVGHLPVKKMSTGSARPPAGRAEFIHGGEADGDTQDDILFLGRKDDEIYICERNDFSFRILRLCPT